MSSGIQMSLVLKEEKSKCKGPGVGEVGLQEGQVQAGEFRTLETGRGCHRESQ